MPSYAIEPEDTGVRDLRGIVERGARRFGDAPAIVLPSATLTFADLDELARRAAHVLAGRGVGAGDVVAALCGNTPAALATWFGCARLGAVYMPVNPLLRHDPLRAVLESAGTAVVVVDADLLDALGEVRAALPRLRHVLVAGSAPVGGAEDYGALLDAAPTTDLGAPPDDSGAPAKLMYTSGTTGVPKGVVWSRACEATHGIAYGDELVTVEPGEGVYCCLPLSHVTCQGTTLATLWRGGRITLDPGFDALGFWRRVREADARVFTFVGTILSVLGRRRPRPDDADNPARLALGAAAPADLWREVEERFDLQVVDVWGQTETASCWTHPASLPQVPGTVGRATSRFDAALVDPGDEAPRPGPRDDGDEVPTGAPGELWIRPTRPDLLFSGYLQGRAEGRLTGDALDRSAFTADGWYRTGDLMTRTADGDLCFTGRIREAIRRRGEMIAAGDVEAAARRHPDVAEAAAVGVPADDGVEEEIKLCVVLHDDAAVDAPGLHAHLVEHLPRFMVPRYLDLRPDLPKTPSTRVRKFALVAEGAAPAWDARHPDRTPAPPAPGAPG